MALRRYGRAPFWAVLKKLTCIGFRDRQRSEAVRKRCSVGLKLITKEIKS